MRSIQKEFGHLWPKESLPQLEPFLSKIPVAVYPVDKLEILKTENKKMVIVIRDAHVRDVVKLLEEGFDHCVQSTRDDFAAELLASSLMLSRPDSFVRNPVSFFLNGLNTVNGVVRPERQLRLPFTSSSQKGELMDQLKDFIDANPEMTAIHDLLLQSADELIQNAIYNAPIRPSGIRPNQAIKRDAPASIEKATPAVLFACYSESRVIIGCEDPWGSLARKTLMMHLRNLYKDDDSSVRGTGEGAGLGFKYLIENAANLYVLSESQKRTIVACGFLLKGWRANTSAAKHFHLSFL